MHAKRLDPILPQQLLLPPIDIPQTNIHQLPRTNRMLLPQPPKDILLLLTRQPRQKRHRHPMDIPTRTHLGDIDIRMRIHPNNRRLATQPLPHGLLRPRDTPHRDGMVAAKREHELALARVAVDLRGELLGDGAHGSGLFHAAVVRVVGGGDVFVVVDFAVVVDLVVEVFAELVQEAGLD